MNYATLAPDMDRLPWLTDEKAAAPTRRSNPLLLWSLLAALLVAGVSYRIGMGAGVDDWVAGLEREERSPSTTIALPEPLVTAPVEEFAPAPMPDVAPTTPTPPVELSAPRPARTVTRAPSAASTPSTGAAPKSEEEANPPAEEYKPQVLWPANQSEGSEGRIVRIGTFSSRLQAKRGWRYIVRTYPGMSRLKAVVVGNTSARDGRTYYRLQFGTTSQAHSAVLCQWMRSIGESCVTVGLPADGA